MKHINISAIAASLLFFLSGCASAPLGTPSGRPEITFARTSKAKIVNELKAGLLPSGASIVEETPSRIVFGKADDSMGAAIYRVMAVGSGSSPTQTEGHFTFVDSPGGVTVYSSSFIINQSVLGRVRKDEVDSPKNFRILQDFLERLKAKLEG